MLVQILIAEDFGVDLRDLAGDVHGRGLSVLGSVDDRLVQRPSLYPCFA